MASAMRYRFGNQAMPAPYALPAAFAMFLVLGTAAAALHGRLAATGVLAACAAITAAMSFAAEPVAAVFLAGIGWLTASGFSRPPYAQLRPTGPAAVHAAVVLAGCALAGAVLGLVFRWQARRRTLVHVGVRGGRRVSSARVSSAGSAESASALRSGEGPSGEGAISVRRRLSG